MAFIHTCMWQVNKVLFWSGVANIRRRRTAVQSRHLESIKTALNTCSSSGITTGMDVEIAKRTMVELEREAEKVSLFDRSCHPLGICFLHVVIDSR